MLNAIFTGRGGGHVFGIPKTTESAHQQHRSAGKSCIKLIHARKFTFQSNITKKTLQETSICGRIRIR